MIYPRQMAEMERTRVKNLRAYAREATKPRVVLELLHQAALAEIQADRFEGRRLWS